MPNISGRIRPLGHNPRTARLAVNGWQFSFFGHRLTTDAITKRDCNVVFSHGDGIRFIDSVSGHDLKIPVDTQGRFLRTDGTPLFIQDMPVDTVNGKDQKKPGLSFFEVALGYDGSIINRRNIMEDKNKFYAEFLRQTSEKQDYSIALKAVSDDKGVLVFEHEGRRIVLQTGEESKQVFIVPQLILGETSCFIFREDRTYLDEVGFDPQYKVFFRDFKGTTNYHVILDEKDGIPQADILNLSLRFAGKYREKGQVARVKFKDGQLTEIHMIGNKNTLRFKLNGIIDGKNIVILGGAAIKIEKRKAAGETPKVVIRSGIVKGTRRYWFRFADKRNMIIAKDDAERLELKPGETIEIEQIGIHPTALLVNREHKSVRINFILNWAWTGDKFSLDDTSCSDIKAERSTGFRIIEQARTRKANNIEYFSMADNKQTLIGRTPFDTKPVPICALVLDGKEILFYKDTQRFSKEEWELCELIVRAKSDSGSIQRHEEASQRAKNEAEMLANDAQKDLLRADGLEKAYQLYIDAYRLDPLNFEILKSAMDLREKIILRNRLFIEREKKLKWLIDTFTAKQKPEEQIKLLADHIKAPSENFDTVAYLLEIIFGLAEGNYLEFKDTFQKVAKALPSVIDFDRTAGTRTLYAMRLLLADPNLGYITRWILSNPSKGNEALFTRRKTKNMGLNADDSFKIDWNTPVKRKFRPIRTDGNLLTSTQKWEIVTNNTAFITSIAKKYLDRGLALSDLVHEGMFGAYRAVELFDPERGVLFTTYASWWIRQAITRAIGNTARIIRVPIHAQDFLGRINRAEKELKAELGFDPTDAEIAAFLEVPEAKITSTRKNTKTALSLDNPVLDGDASMGDFVPDHSAPNPEDETIRKILSERLNAGISKFLTDRQIFILEQRFGLNGNADHTLEEVGQMLDLTRERIRQIEKKALEKLLPHISELHEFIE